MGIDRNCGATSYTDASGVVTSPGFPLTYPHSIQCNYYIAAGGNTSVTLNILHFDLEDRTWAGNCVHDYVMIDCLVNGNSYEYPYANRKFCGQINWSSALRIRGCENIVVRFVADSSITGGGFKIHYNVSELGNADNSQTEVDCGNTLFTASNGVITIPRNPTSCLARINCTYTISANQSSTISLNTSSFDHIILRSSFQSCTNENFVIGCVGERHVFSACNYQALFVPYRMFESCQTLKLTLLSDLYDIQDAIQIPFTVVPDRKQSEDGVSDVRCGNTSFSAPSGFILSPNFPYSYPNSINCSYIIDIGSSKLITLEFQQLDLESGHSSLCAYDWIMLQCLSNETTTTPSAYTNRRLCDGPLARFSIRGCYAMKMFFSTDSSVGQRGFKLFYTVSESVCGATNFNGSSGSISSPVFSNAYLHNLNCTFSIDTRPNESIVLDFQVFDIESSIMSHNLSCPHDWLLIRCLSNETALPGSYTNRRLCGQIMPQIILVGCQTVTLQFFTDSSVAKAGFKLNYRKSAELPAPTSDCGNTSFTAPSGIITSPNFPNPHAHNLSCTYTIALAKKSSVVLDFLTFDLEGFNIQRGDPPEIYGNCAHDWLMIRCLSDGSPSPPSNLYTDKRLCGRDLPRISLLGCTNVTLQFITDASIAKGGFRIMYTTSDYASGCGNTSFTGPSGIITSPDYPNPHMHNLDCTYSIASRQNETITLTFKDFELEGGLWEDVYYMEVDFMEFCPHDWLMIRCSPEGRTSPNANENKRLCGRKSQFTWTFSGCSSLSILFVSDSTIANTGFKIQYRIEPEVKNDTSSVSYGTTTTYRSTVLSTSQSPEPSPTVKSTISTSQITSKPGMSTVQSAQPTSATGSVHVVAAQSSNLSRLSVFFISIAVILVVGGIAVLLFLWIRKRYLPLKRDSRLLENEYDNTEVAESEDAAGLSNFIYQRDATVKYVPMKSMND